MRKLYRNLFYFICVLFIVFLLFIRILVGADGDDMFKFHVTWTKMFVFLIYFHHKYLRVASINFYLVENTSATVLNLVNFQKQFLLSRF